jgi:hypothetical protein
MPSNEADGARLARLQGKISLNQIKISKQE